MSRRVGRYRLARQVDGRGSFGEVRVAVELDAPPGIDVAMSYRPAWLREWLEAAIRGCERAVELLDLRTARIEIEDVVLVTVDSTRDAVEAAAALAVADAVGRSDDLVLERADGWRVARRA